MYIFKDPDILLTYFPLKSVNECILMNIFKIFV